MKTIEKQISDLKTARKIILGVAEKMEGKKNVQNEIAIIYDVSLTLLDVMEILDKFQKLLEEVEW